MKWRLLPVVAIPLSLTVPQAKWAAQGTRVPLAFTHVTVIDTEHGLTEDDQAVLVEGTRITNVGKAGTVTLPSDAGVVDGSGKFLIPGLWDMHVHVFNYVTGRTPNEWYFPLFIANGVTSVREMWTKPESMKVVSNWRQELVENRSVLPRFAAVGTVVDGRPPRKRNTDTVDTPEQARQIVRRIKGAGVDFDKVYDTLGRDEYFAIASRDFTM